MKQYLQQLFDIKNFGTDKGAARENMPTTRALFGLQEKYKLSDGFPAVTTKQLYWKGVCVELLWFLRGDTNIKFLDDHGVCKMWHQDAYNYYKKVCAGYCKENNISSDFIMNEDQFYETIKSKSKLAYSILMPGFPPFHIPGYNIGDCGYQYGKVWRAWDGLHYMYVGDEGNKHVDIDGSCTDQIVRLINGIKNNPEGRRHVVTATDPAHDNELALYWCHNFFQVNCRRIPTSERLRMMDFRFGGHSSVEPYDEYWINEELRNKNIPEFYMDLLFYQRSADMFLGVPLNIASYALLTHILCKVLNMVPGVLTHTLGDAHIYSDHMDAVNEQLSRETKDLPVLKFSDHFIDVSRDLNSKLMKSENGILTHDFDLFIDSLRHEDFILGGYDPHPAIKANLSTGIKR